MFSVLTYLAINLVAFMFILGTVLVLGFCTYKLVANRKHFKDDSTHTTLIWLFVFIDIAFVSFFAYHLLGFFAK